ncbi:MAG: SDR family NAD(P)-dependent oxidoreductase, partial [Bacteroidota bacterium]
MKILVTGGAGFIGSNLTDSLLLQGHEVRIIDNLSTGLLDNIQHMMENANLRFIKGDVTDRELMEESIEWADHIYHLAAPVGVKYIMENPVKTVLDNIRGADLMLELVNKYKKRVLIASTSEIYGKSLDLLDATGT